MSTILRAFGADSDCFVVSARVQAAILCSAHYQFTLIYYQY